MSYSRAGRSSRVLVIEKELQSVDLEVLCTPSLPRMQSAQQLRKGSPCYPQYTTEVCQHLPQPWSALGNAGLEKGGGVVPTREAG